MVIFCCLKAIFLLLSEGDFSVAVLRRLVSVNVLRRFILLLFLGVFSLLLVYRLLLPPLYVEVFGF